MKKRFVMIVMAALSACAAGCGSSGQNAAETTTEVQDAASVLENASEYVELGDYKNISVEKSHADISDDTVEQQVKYRIQTYLAYEEIEGRDTVESGDYVNIDATCRIDGEVVEDYSGEDFEVEPASSFYYSDDGFYDQLVGKKKGDTFEVALTFPDEYEDENVAGRDCVMEVTVNKIEEQVYPSLTDDFVKTYTDCDSVAEYTEKVREILEETEERQTDVSNIMEAITEQSTIKKDFPEEAVEDEIEQLESDYENYAESYDMDVDEYIEEVSGMTLSECAQSELKWQCVKELLMEAEDITATDEDFEAEITEITEQSGYTRENVLAYYTEEELWESARETGLEDALLNYVTFTDE